MPSAVTVLPCSSDPLVTSCSQNELRTALHWYLVNYLMLGHTSNGRTQPPIGRARAPVCPSLATPLDTIRESGHNLLTYRVRGGHCRTRSAVAPGWPSFLLLDHLSTSQKDSSVRILKLLQSLTSLHFPTG